MNFNFLTYGFVLVILAVAVSIDRSDRGVEGASEYLPNAEVVSKSNQNRQITYSASLDSRRNRNVNESLFKSDLPLSSTPIFMDSYSIEFLQGDALESSIRDVLNDFDPESRSTALNEVYRLDHNAAVNLLYEVILKDKNGSVVDKAVSALADIAGDRSVSLVTTGLSDSDVMVRSESIEVLGLIGEYGYSLLGQVLLSDPDTGLRLRAMELLAADGGEAAISLIASVVDDVNPEISRTAKQILMDNQFSTATWQAGEGSNQLYSVNEELTFDPENPIFYLTNKSLPEERIDALWRMPSVDEDAVQTLQVVLQQDKDLTVRQEALSVLESIGSETSFSVITSALGDDSSELRQAALESLWRNDAQDRLAIAGQVMYSDPAPSVRLEAIRLLARESYPAARSLLSAARNDSDEQVSQYAAYLLQQDL
ncbi:HEAT repeat domain-containing protein [Amphritea sp.]|uniref:HEAT repeat domain-containing protein n=1 Tax=Amphritea sp. TaxID=1872502 RepID=UPI003D0D3091